MRCLEEGELRAWIDGAAAEQAAVGAHVDGCAACRAVAEELRANAELAAAATGVLAPARPLQAAQVEAARERVATAARWPATQTIPAGQPERRGLAAASRSARQALPLRPAARGWLAAAVTGVLAVALIATPAGRSAASGFLAQFRSQRFAVVTFDPSQAGDLADALRQLGTVQGDLGGVEPSPVATPAAASRLVGFPVALPAATALPSGVDTRPRIMVTPGRQLRFTLHAAQVGRYLQAHGRSAANVPAGLDGATLVANVPAAALLEYVAADGSPRLVVGQSRELTASVQGAVTLEALREFLLDLPGLPPQTVRQLRAIGDWRDTLPLPVPADRIDWHATTIHGMQGLVLGERSGLGSAVIWQRDGRIYGVAGVLRQAHVLRVAESLA
ncbi:MAG TPA: hypothetical protein VFU54_13650 [Actinomycetota bacterium]|nr:hypothetical protein [Actinomycetota bacterium]